MRQVGRCGARQGSRETNPRISTWARALGSWCAEAHPTGEGLESSGVAVGARSVALRDDAWRVVIVRGAPPCDLSKRTQRAYEVTALTSRASAWVWARRRARRSRRVGRGVA